MEDFNFYWPSVGFLNEILKREIKTDATFPTYFSDFLLFRYLDPREDFPLIVTR